MEFSVLFENDLLFGIGILESLHAWDNYLGTFLYWISWIGHKLGSNIFFMALLSVTYLVFNPRLGIGLGYALLSAGIINSIAKFIFESPRPNGLSSEITNLQASAEEFAFGFPSGHVQATTVMWGFLFFRIKNIWVRSLAIYVILIMPFARMYMGVHYLGDCLGALFMGGLNLWFILWFTNRFPNFPDLGDSQITTRVTRTAVLVTIATTLSPVLLYNNQLSSGHIFSLNTLISSSAALGGFIIGTMLLKIGSFRTEIYWSSYKESLANPKESLAVRLLVLVFGLIFFYLIPGQILKSFDWGDEVLIRYFRYLIVGLFFVWIAPSILFYIKDGKYFKKNLNA
ncbi:phosphatase PAP2 family protein [Leptospira sp. GIMC2001]|uniref:phosphatase PAP2 family protein n=1 Tax=Leptospira sp. GIMC2001 TaxID=1513297 RepID=UPI00234B2FA5|nr:phosphatase PAP2 family protein [Leptospira sp. GIMC2001]WCL48782.1 phosphatase PAP2 family protein [Leptospira sp. GIMC2001]